MKNKAPQERLKKLKKQHRKKKIKVNKYEEWLGASFPILELYPGRYELGDTFRKIMR